MRRLDATVWWLTMATVAIVPLLAAPNAHDWLRIPKTAFFDAIMLLLGGLTVAWLLTGAVDLRRVARHRIACAIAAAAVLWTAVTSMTAVTPAVSGFATVSVLTCAIAFVLTLLFARGTAAPLAALLLPAVANAIFASLQELDLWSPVRLLAAQEARQNTIGLLGNPDYVAVYLIVPCVAALAGALAFRRHRALLLLAFAVLVAGVMFTLSVTGVIALSAALVALAFSTRSPRVRWLMAAAAVCIAIAILAYRPTRERAITLAEHVQEGRWLEFSSFRLPAFAVAVSMFGDHPLTGVGPGGYESRYMSYKLANDERYPQWIVPATTNFGEAHNDHLQLLAETGLPGYALFAFALVHFAALSFRRRSAPPSDRQRFSRLFALPAATGFGVAALAQFPLHLTACTATAVFAAAIAYVWSDDEAEEEVEPQRLFAGATRAFAGAVAIAAIAVACLGAYRLGWMRFRAEVVKRRAETRLNQNVASDYIRGNIGRSVMSELAPWLEYNPADYQTRFLMGLAADQSERKEDAIRYYAEALKLNERPEIYGNMALLQLERGEVEEGQRNMTRAAIFNLAVTNDVEPSMRADILVAVHARRERLLQRAKQMR